MNKPRLPKAANAIFSRIELENTQHLAKLQADAALIRSLKERRGKVQTRVADLEEAKRAGLLFREKREIIEGRVPKDYQPERIPDDSLLLREYEERDRIDAQIAKLKLDGEQPRMTAVKLMAELDPFAKYVTHAAAPSREKGALPRKREAIEAKRAERKVVSRASRTYEEVRDTAMSSVRALAARGCPKVLPAFQGGEIEWPKAQVPNPGSAGYAFVPDGVALVAFLFQDELERKLDSLLEFNRPADAISASDQRAKLAAIDEELMALYREEAATVEAIVADGGNAFHLADRPALAVLGIRRA